MELEADSGFNLKVDPEALIERIILPPDINNRQLTHVGGTSILARNGRGRCGERPHARNGRSRATRRAAAASGAGRDAHTCPAGRDTRRPSYRPGGLRKGEAASVVPRPRKHRRHEERSGGRGMPSGRGLSGVVAGAGCSVSLLGGRLLFETAEQLRDVGTILPTPMGADRREQPSSRLVAQMSVPSVVEDEPWCRDDPWALQHGVNQWEVRPAELVGEKPVDIERVCEDDAVGFAVVEAKRWPRVWCIPAFVGVLDRVVATGRKDVTRGCPVDILILRDVTELCNDFRRHEHVTRREQILKRVEGIGTDSRIGPGNGETDQRAGVGDDRSQLPAAHPSSSVAVSTAVTSPS